ncbi:MAG: type IV secretion protein IcmL [Gammaproteobacteria bacterium CG_4_10_14_0_8_um_filter_38_16]|nr:MAG: type IV secretion protein IcmL [Gammaproteobacteria bacterium CG_4_10_14_0_8_um_filter_38_16]PJA04402.1 MAG: type IV secretion protein IcmL [Gammaproteobacteria bacterium CG_4_10_14_0_2_um_filter_38_22]PJB10177.1 MAG: type IV secretion protein IcmL [Gammaproteobacteria bacterium CG_4_9_14_3_um_filter_38_9]
MNTDSQELALQLNKFYRDAYRRTMKWLVFLVVICAILSCVLAWMTYDRKQPLYYAAATNGDVVPMHSLSEPVITSSFIVRWSALTTRLIYNLSFSRYQKQLAQVKPRFTTEGWAKMMSALKASGFLSELVDKRLIISSVVSGPPVILARMIVHGRFTWRVQLPLLVTYTSASTSSQRNIVITIDVQRVPTLNASQGIQIINFLSKPAE